MEPETTPSSSITKTSLVNVVAYIINVVITYGIGVAGFFGLPTNDELSAKYQTLVTPIGWAFSIWAIIFLSQLVWSIVQFTGKFRQSELITSVGFKYALVVAAQVGWTLAFSMEMILISLVFMIAIWFALMSIVLPLSKRTSSFLDYVLFKFPFTIHFGWITAATAVNVNVLLVDMGVSSKVQLYAGLGSIVALFVFGLGIVCARIDLVVPVVLAWALVGVYFELINPLESITGAFTEAQIKQVRFLGAGIAVSLLLSVALQAIQKIRGTRNREVSSNEGESEYLRQDDNP